MGCLGGALLLANLSLAQVSVTEITEPTEAMPEGAPMDDITTRSVVTDRPVLAYAPIREADILWEKRIWRVIDVREKMNLPFRAPEAPFFTILADAAERGEVIATADDRFKQRLSSEQIHNMLVTIDTVEVLNPITYEIETRVIENQINWENVKRFRIKESWYFDANTSQLKVRILGIAPMIEEMDKDGNFKFERPLFWVHYPTARPALARQKVISPDGNFATTTTWEDWLEMRRFASVITKENNVYDRRIQDYLTGVDALMASQGISDNMFNLEHDMWSY